MLNDNRWSISRNVGFVARYLAHLRVRPRYVRFKNAVGNFLSHIPLIGKGLYNLLIRVKTALKNSVYKNSSMFEEMGFHYLGPIDGHNLKDLTKALETAKRINKPVLLHVETVKGKGYSFAMESPDTYHGVGKFDVETGQTPPGRPFFFVGVRRLSDQTGGGGSQYLRHYGGHAHRHLPAGVCGQISQAPF